MRYPSFVCVVAVGNLIIENVQEGDGGTYICRAENVAGQPQANVVFVEILGRVRHSCLFIAPLAKCFHSIQFIDHFCSPPFRVTRCPGLPGTVPEWNKMSRVPPRSIPGQCNVPE